MCVTLSTPASPVKRLADWLCMGTEFVMDRSCPGWMEQKQADCGILAFYELKAVTPPPRALEQTDKQQ